MAHPKLAIAPDVSDVQSFVGHDVTEAFLRAFFLPGDWAVQFLTKIGLLTPIYDVLNLGRPNMGGMLSFVVSAFIWFLPVWVLKHMLSAK